MAGLFHTAVYTPLYNALVAILSVLPHADVGVAVILLTVAVKVALFPLAKRAIHTQAALRKIAPELEALKKTYADKKEEQVRAMMALYKENGIHPLSGFFTILIQLPIIFGLYWVFAKGGLPTVDTSLLYSFVSPPETVSMHLFGMLDLTAKSLPLAFLAGITQFLHARIAVPPHVSDAKPGESFKDDMMRSLSIQTRYVLPVIIAVAAYTLSAAIALYWATSNTFTLIQEIIVRKRGGLR